MPTEIAGVNASELRLLPESSVSLRLPARFDEIEMKLRIFPALLASMCLAGCVEQLMAIKNSNYAEIQTEKYLDQPGQCAHLIDVSYHIENGHSPVLKDVSDFEPMTNRSIEATPPADRTVLDPRYDRGVVVPQRARYDCYAAALATAWRAAGFDAEESTFTAIADHSCGMGLTRAITYLRLLSLINRAETGEEYNFLPSPMTDSGNLNLTAFPETFHFWQGKPSLSPFGDIATSGLGWLCTACKNKKINLTTFDAAIFIENMPRVGLRPGEPTPPLPPMPLLEALRFNGQPWIPIYTPIMWHRNDNPSIIGGIYPVGSTADLAYFFEGQYILLAGLKDSVAGHIVLITGLRYRPSGFVLRSPRENAIMLDDNTQIESIQILDPAEHGQRTWRDEGPNGVLHNMQFIIAFRLT